MADLFNAVLLLLGLCGSSLLGRRVHRALPESHRTQETLDFVRTVSGLLVTLTALVLGLLLVAVDGDFRKTSADLRVYGSMITLLDAELSNLGPAGQPMRAELRQYTAAAIASTRPDETPPGGSYPPPDVVGADMDSDVLGHLLHTIETGIRRVAPQGPEAEEAKASALSRISSLLDQRGTLIGDAHGTVTPLIFTAMVIWLMIVFFSFGLTGQQNWTTMASIVIVAVAVTSAVSITFELAGPLDGYIKATSAPMRKALRYLDRTSSAPTTPPP